MWLSLFSRHRVSTARTVEAGIPSFEAIGTHAGNAAPHALQYLIGAATQTPHGLGVRLLLPSALTAARNAIGDRLATLAAVCGLDVDDASEAEAADAFQTRLVRLLAEIGIPASLAEMASGVTRLVQNHPGPTDTANLTAILEAAWAGDPDRLDT